MTDKELTPAEAEAVRRLLAEARHDEAIPPEVAARLEGVIIGLAADRSEAAEPAPAGPLANVVPLRRPGRLPRLLMAAAAVAVIGFGATQLIGNPTGQNDTGPTAAKTDRSVSQEVASGGATDSGSGELRKTPAATAPQAPPADGVEVYDQLLSRLNSTKSLSGLTKLNDKNLGRWTDALVDSPAYQSSDDNVRGARNFLGIECGPIYTVEGSRTIAALFKKQPALVLVYPKIQGSTLVEVFVCTNKTPRRAVRSVILTDGE